MTLAKVTVCRSAWPGLAPEQKLGITGVMKILRVLFCLSLTFSALRTGAEDLSALARLDAEASSVTERRGGMQVDLALSQPVPWRARLLDNPARLVMDFREVDWTGLEYLPVYADNSLLSLRAGVFRPGWSRMVLELSGPYIIVSAQMDTTGGAARLNVELAAASAERFAIEADRPEAPEWRLPNAVDIPPAVKRGDSPLIVVLDPGHGGIDPGAERDGFSEADLMLTFARELRERLMADGRFAVVMTREEDVFVPLEARISVARAAGAHVFVSLHADTLAEGEAEGATVYSLKEDATDAAALALAERHDRDDLLAGLDLSGQDDRIAGVLIDMARAETAPRIRRLSAALAGAFEASDLKTHPKPEQGAGFSVLKSPDIPSVLIELGFLSSPIDLARITDPEWRGQMAQAIQTGLLAWAEADAALLAKPIDKVE